MADLRLASGGSNLIRFTIKNSSTGVGLTGLTFSSAGLIISTIADNEATATAYTQAGGTIETITTLGTYAAPTATKCRFKEVDAANHPGLYEFQIADARFAVTGSKRLVISTSGAASQLAADYEIQLVAFNPYDAVRMGLTSLPNVASGSAGAIPTTGTGSNQISVASGLVTLAPVTHTGARIPNVTLADTVTTYTGNTPQTGDAFARLGAPAGASHAADVAAVKGDTGGLRTDYTTARAGYLDTLNGIVAAIWAYATRTLSAFGFTVATVADPNVALIKAKTDNLPPDPADASDIATAFNAVTAAIPTSAAIADRFLNRNLAGGSDVGRLVKDALRPARNKVTIVGSTMTVYAEDDTTPAWTGAVVTNGAALPITSVDPA